MLEGDASDHILTLSKQSSSCKYCSYLRLKHKNEGKDGDPPSISSVYRRCTKCNVHLCAIHYDIYHNELIDSDSDNDINMISV